MGAVPARTVVRVNGAHLVALAPEDIHSTYTAAAVPSLVMMIMYPHKWTFLQGIVAGDSGLGMRAMVRGRERFKHFYQLLSI